jgi:hypothetical protein
MKYVLLLVLDGINKHQITICYIESFGHEKILSCIGRNMTKLPVITLTRMQYYLISVNILSTARCHYLFQLAESTKTSRPRLGSSATRATRGRVLNTTTRCGAVTVTVSVLLYKASNRGSIRD